MSDYFRTPDDLAGIKETADKYGFCIVKNFFSSARMAEMEDLLAKAKERGTHDLMSVDSLRPILLDQRLLSIAKALLGPQLVYYGETAMNYEREAGALTANPFRVLHADARGTPSDINQTWDPKPGQVFKGYRFGIYFRDYTDFSGGLKVVPGSHLVTQGKYKNPFSFFKKLFAKKLSLNGGSVKVPTPSFDLYDLESRPGDLVIFSLRVFHSAGATRLKDAPSLALHPEIENQLWSSKREIFLPYPNGPRNTMFFDYGAPSEELDLYIKWRAWRGYNSKLDEADYYAFDREDVIKEAEENAVTMRFDKIIAAAAVRGQMDRCKRLQSNNKEFSDYHSLTIS